MWVSWSSLMQLIILLLLLWFNIGSCKGCVEQERAALLQFKRSLKMGVLSWPVDDRDQSDCCGWDRVQCNPTGRVTHLSLYGLSLLPIFDRLKSDGLKGVWFLNATVFLPLEELQYLDLSENAIYGCLENEGFERLSSLKKLEFLDLSYNNFNSSSILTSLSALPSLKELYLGQNEIFNGMQDFERLSSLKKLEVLYLSYNNFNSSIFTSLSGAFPSLKELYLEGNEFGNGPLLTQGLKKLAKLKLAKLKRLEGLGIYIHGQIDDNLLSSLASIKSLKNLTLQIFNNLNINGSNLLQSGSLDILSHGLKRLEKLDLLLYGYDISNMSFLGALTSLKELTLQFDAFNGSLGFEIWSELKKLEILEMDIPNFNENLLLSLGALTSLKTLYLDGVGPFPHALGREVFSKLKNLENLGGSYFNNSNIILPFLTTLISLKQLDLRDNNLYGPFLQGFCALKNLEELDLSLNKFEGIIPACLTNLTSLRVLYLSRNQFRGRIPSSDLMSNLISLETIYIGYNNFEPTFPLTSFANNSKLVDIYLEDYSINWEVEIEELSNFVPKFQLKSLFMSNCNFKKPIDIALKFLGNQYDLQEIHLSHANLKGKFPTWLIENNTRLEILYLRNNSLSGHFHQLIHSPTNLIDLDISNNHIQGHLQENINEVLPNLQYMNLSRNDIGGPIPFAIGGMQQLVRLDLSSNKFSGEIPDSLAVDSTMLQFLSLSNNSLYGQIFPKSFDLPWLLVLLLNGNNFTGMIPIGLSNCYWLEALDVSQNHLSGTIPAWIGNLASLRTIVLRGNSFEGHIPLQFCKLINLEHLDLSGNHLSGSLPSCMNSTNLEYVHLQGNKFTGSIPDAFRRSTSVVIMNLGENSFFGSIPNWIGVLTNLKVLVLRDNHLKGLLPYQLCQLNQISIMDLSHNNFFGIIPSCFSNITFGKINITHTFGTRYWDQYSSKLTNLRIFSVYDPWIIEQEEVEIKTKKMSYPYKGKDLTMMSVLDLSSNNLTGEIPYEMGALSEVLSLNLSYNQLNGTIPKAFSNLTQVESLDLSHNRLGGGIPSQLIELNFLEMFYVAYNNLSGRIPPFTAQFQTFDESSYEGNPFLCGPPLQKNCTTIASPNPGSVAIFLAHLEDKYGIDRTSFLASFAASCAVTLFGFVAVLYINSYWRRRWFGFIDACYDSFMYNLFDMLIKLSGHSSL